MPSTPSTNSSDTAALPASERRISSVTVAFNPSAERLRSQLAALRGQVDEMIVVDNGSAEAVSDMQGLPREGVRLISLLENRGIAAGFNAGARTAFADGAHMVLLMDDDSVPAPDMVARMVEAYEACSPRNRVAALGPRIQDARDPREYPFIRMGWTHNRHVRCGESGGVVDCDFLISSGTLIPRAAFEAAGAFDEGLFIDSVDLEWCCRVRARGMLLYGVCDARLDHRLGDRRQTVLRSFELVVHSPERIYYMTRNRLMLYARPYMPLKWKVKDLLRAVAKFATTMLLLAPRREYARMTLRALRDAFAGRGGKLQGHDA